MVVHIPLSENILTNCRRIWVVVNVGGGRQVVINNLKLWDADTEWQCITEKFNIYNKVVKVMYIYDTDLWIQLTQQFCLLLVGIVYYAFGCCFNSLKVVNGKFELSSLSRLLCKSQTSFINSFMSHDECNYFQSSFIYLHIYPFVNKLCFICDYTVFVNYSCL